jgi:hypothetical protein
VAVAGAASTTKPTKSMNQKPRLMGVLELTRFCGHLSIGDVSPPEGSPHGTNEATLYAGVPH